MNPGTDRYERVHAIFERARRLSGEERERCLAEACGADTDLRQDVEELMSALENEAPFEFSETGIAAARGQIESLMRAEASSWLPEHVGSYRITDRIGEGGMGVVYAAEQESPRRQVAVKLLHPQLASPDHLRRFRLESEVLGRLHHPGIAQIIESGTFDVGRGEQPFFAMELVEGVALHAYAQRQELDLRKRLELLAATAEAVQHAHDRGIVHRDLKPDNVMVDGEGRIKVLDFGIARVIGDDLHLTASLTSTGQIVGTLSYMAPEQLDAASDAATPLVDVYALGAIAFELFAGRPPHSLAGLTPAQSVQRITSRDATRLDAVARDMPDDVVTIVGKALASDPERRYVSAAAFAADLRRFLAHEPIEARPPSRIYLARRFARRHRGLVTGAAAAIAALIAGTGIAIFFALGERAQRNVAAEKADLAESSSREMARSLLLASRRALAFGDPWTAGFDLRTVPRQYRGWEWSYLARRIPHIVPFPITGLYRRFTPDGQAIVFSEELRVWDLAQERWRDPPFPELWAQSLSNFVGSQVLINNSRDWTLHLLDFTRGRELARVPFPTTYAWRLSLSPNGRHGVATTEFAATKLWRDLGELVDIDLHIEGRGALGTSAVFSPDSRRLAIGECAGLEGLVRVFDIATLDELVLREFQARWDQEVSSVKGVRIRWHPTEDELVLASWNGEIRLLDASTLETRRVLREAEEGAPNLHTVQYSPDGERIAFHQYGRGVEVITRASGETLLYEGFPHERADIWSELAFSADGRTLLAGSPNRHPTLLRVDEEDRAPYRELSRHSDYIDQLAVSRDGGLLASAAPFDPLVHVMDVTAGELVCTFERPAGKGNRSSYLAFAQDGRTLWATLPAPGPDTMDIVCWDLLTGEETRTDRAVPREELAAAFVRSLEMDTLQLSARAAVTQGSFATLDSEGKWGKDPYSDTGLSIGPAPDMGRPTGALGVGLSFHPTEPVLAVTETDGLRLLNAVDGTPRGSGLSDDSLQSTAGGVRTGSNASVAFSSDGSRLAIGKSEAAIRILETETYNTVLELAFERVGRGMWRKENFVYTVCWAPDDAWLASGSGDGAVRVWDAIDPDVQRERRETHAELAESMREQLRARSMELGDWAQAARELFSDESLSAQERSALRRAAIDSWADR